MVKKGSSRVDEVLSVRGMAEDLWDKKYRLGWIHNKIENYLFQREFNVSTNVIARIYRDHVKEDGIVYEGEMSDKSLEDFPINESIRKDSATDSKSVIPGEGKKRRLTNTEAIEIFRKNESHIRDNHEDEDVTLYDNFRWVVYFNERKRFAGYNFSEKKLYELFKGFMENEMGMNLGRRVKKEPWELDTEFYL